MHSSAKFEGRAKSEIFIKQIATTDVEKPYKGPRELDNINKWYISNSEMKVGVFLAETNIRSHTSSCPAGFFKKACISNIQQPHRPPAVLTVAIGGNL